MKREKVNITHNGNTLLALVKWNILLGGRERESRIFFSLSRYNALSQISDAERGVQLTRCKDKSPTPFDSFISLPLFLFVYLKILFKDLLFEEGGATFCPSIVICGPLPLPPPIHPRPSPLSSVFFNVRERRGRGGQFEERSGGASGLFIAESPSKNHPFFSPSPPFFQIVHFSFLSRLCLFTISLEYYCNKW